MNKKQLDQKSCKNDTLVSQITSCSSKRKLTSILELTTGKEGNAEQDYEKLLCPLLASMLYPELDFAQPQSRTHEGVLIRDLIFYNNTGSPRLRNIRLWSSQSF